MTTTPSLLIVHQGALGDLVCIFPIIAALRRRFRPVAILCQGQLGRLAAAEQLVDAWFGIEAAWAASLFTRDPAPQARRALAPFSHHLVFSMSEALAASLEQIAGARIGRVPPRPPAGRRRHVTEHALSCIRELGWLPGAAADAIPPPAPTHGSPAPHPGGHGSKTVLLHPGAGSPRKRWPLAGFLELADRIMARDLNPEFVIGPAEHDLLTGLERRAAVVHRPTDCLHLLDLFRSAAAYVGNDSGASHLAAWAGLPSVAIFGPTDPARWRPRGYAVAIVQAPLECLPCFETAADNCAAGDCLAAVAPQDVLGALERLILARPSDTSAGSTPMPGELKCNSSA
jgi:heptosyltransferase III